MAKISESSKRYNELQEKWWQLKHANIMCMAHARGYEDVDIAGNYEKMQNIEKELEELEV